MIFPSIRIEGVIVSPDILDRIEDAQGQRPVDFGLESSAKVKDEILRVWADAQHYWGAFQRKLESLKGDSPATTETRNLWVVPLLTLLGYQLEYQARGAEVNEKTYPISHRVVNRGNTAFHVIGYQEPSGLDKKPEKMALRMSAHAMVQEYLNLDDQLYGLVTNGRLLRLLRNSSRLVKLSYLEFDLDRIFADGLFADFAVLFRLLHASRLPQSGAPGSSCWLERYHQETIEQGTRIRDGLRDAVTEALEILGTGFLAHPNNATLRQQVKSGELRTDVYFGYLLRLIYRLLFLMVIEERRLVFPAGADPNKVALYFEHYSVQRLRRLSVTRGIKIERFHDAWLSLLSTFQLFEIPAKADKFGTTVLGGQLFNPESLGPLVESRLDNAALFGALDRLCYFYHPETKQRIPVNFGALATEEFGSVYESLLELHPVAEIEPKPHFGFRQVAGNERKTTGTYYTPTSLVTCLLDSALDPVLEERIQNFKSLGFKTVDEAVLALNVCDPACGSGHFLIAAAQRIARRLAILRAGDQEPSPALLRHTLREVIGNCIHGVDVNPMSVELCKVALWLEAVEPGKPLNFLDHHIKCGNSLLGATPDCIRDGIPDKAYEPITGDDKEAAKWMRKLNKDAREGQTHFDFTDAKPWERLGNLPAAMAKLELLDDETPEALHARETLYRQIVEGSGYESARLLHDAWCAAFVWPKHSCEYGTELTTEHLYKIERNPHSVLPSLKAEVRELALQYRFFHWHLEFPTVFRSDAEGGFDVIVGNPPWDRIKLQEKEFFASLAPDIANAANAAARKKAITRLQTDAPEIWREWQDALRRADGELTLVRNGGRYPLCGRGDINTYSIFAELNRSLTGEAGCAGCIVPTGIATDSTTQLFFKDLMETQSLRCLFGFENEGKLFPSVDHRVNFCVLVVQRTPTRTDAEFAAFLRHPDVLREEGRRYRLNAADIALLNPNTRTCPVFRSDRDAELTKAIYRRIPVLWKDDKSEGNLWNVSFRSMFHMSGDSGLFRSREELAESHWCLHGNVFIREKTRMLPLYEAKMIYHFNHRFGDFGLVEPGDRAHILPTPGIELLAQPDYVPMPRYWVDEREVTSRIDEWWLKEWFIGWRDVTDPRSSIRTVVACIIPRTGVSGKFPLLLARQHPEWFLSAILSSFVLDYVARQKIGGVSLSMFVMRQLPILPPNVANALCNWIGNSLDMANFVRPRMLELTYTAWDLEAFAQDCRLSGPPFRWDEERRFILRCELDAAFFHLYLSSQADGSWRMARRSDGCPYDETPEQLAELKRHFPTPRDAVAYIMDTFPIVKRKDEEKYNGTTAPSASSAKSTTPCRKPSVLANRIRRASTRLPGHQPTNTAISSPCPNGSPKTGPRTSTRRETRSASLSDWLLRLAERPLLTGREYCDELLRAVMNVTPTAFPCLILK